MSDQSEKVPSRSIGGSGPKNNSQGKPPARKVIHWRVWYRLIFLVVHKGIDAPSLLLAVASGEQASRQGKTAGPADADRKPAGRTSKIGSCSELNRHCKFHFGHIGADSDQSKTSDGAPVALFEGYEILNGKLCFGVLGVDGFSGRGPTAPSASRMTRILLVALSVAGRRAKQPTGARPTRATMARQKFKLPPLRAERRRYLALVWENYGTRPTKCSRHPGDIPVGLDPQFSMSKKNDGRNPAVNTADRVSLRCRTPWLNCSSVFAERNFITTISSATTTP